MKKIIHYLALLMCVMMFCSCVDDVVFGSIGDRVVVANCILKYPSAEQSVSIVTSAAVGTESMGNPVKNAIVTIRDISAPESEPVTFIYDAGSEYKANMSVIPGHRYRLDINIHGREPIFSETEVPLTKSIDVSFENLHHGMDSFLGFSVYFYNIKKLFGRPFWLYSMRYNQALEDWELSEYIGGGYRGLVKLGYTAVDMFNITEKRIPYRTVFTDSFGEKFYQHDYYIRFTGEQDDIEELREEWYDRLIIYDTDTIFLDGEGFEGEYFNTPFDEVTTIYPDKERPEDGKGVVVLSVPSENLDTYMKELCIYRESHENMKDLTALYEKSDLYSNMSPGAKGIFGAQIIYYLPWTEPRSPLY